MKFTEKLETAEAVVKKFGPITKNQLLAYLKIVCGSEKEEVEYIIRQSAGKKGMHEDSSTNILRAYPSQRLDRKRLVAFWILLEHITEAAGRVFKAEYPSQIGFCTEENVFLITVCDNKYADKELIALREKEREDVTDIIVGINMGLEDIAKSILPKNPFVYVRCDAKNILEDEPSIHWQQAGE